MRAKDLAEKSAARIPELVDSGFLYDTMNRFPQEVIEILEKGGWFHDRMVSDATIEMWRHTLMASHFLEMPVAAEVVLREFGGLTIGSVGAGVNMARTSFDIDLFTSKAEARKYGGLPIART